MKYKVVFDFDDTYTQRSIDVECEHVENISDTIVNNCDVRNQIRVQFDDIINGIVEAYKRNGDPVAGEIGTYEAGETIYFVYLPEYLSNVEEKIQVTIVCKEKIEVSPDIKDKIIWALDYCLCDMIDNRGTSDQGDVDATAVIIACINNFIAQGSWHFGLTNYEITYDSRIITDVKQWPKPVKMGKTVTWVKDQVSLKPVLWFSPINFYLHTANYWSIWGTKEDLMENKSIWFPLSKNTLGATDIDADWVSKCGMDVPELDDKIIKQCPIALSEEDTVDSLLDKINKFFVDQYNKAHEGDC